MIVAWISALAGMTRIRIFKLGVFMEGFDLDSHVSSGDEVSNSDKLVPVGEAIRYRKRAQGAEKEAEQLQEQLREIRAENERITGELESIQNDRMLTDRLTAVGVNDLEAAVLIAKARMKEDEQADIESVVEKLKKQKSYLFGQVEMPAAASKTEVVKERGSSGRGVLERAAKRAATSGNRSDMQEYLRLRRQYV